MSVETMHEGGGEHSRPVDAVFSKLETDTGGLADNEAETRLAEYGPNKIEQDEGPSWAEILLDQFQDYLVYILIIAVVLSVGAGVFPGEQPRWGEGAIITMILVGNALFGFYQDYRAEAEMASLIEMASPTATVRRDGQRREIDAEEVVPGDILILEEGDAVTADARIVKSESLATSESPLTGESVQVRKNTDPVQEQRPVAERSSMVYKGTDVVRGSGLAVVTRTGMATEIGEIATELQLAEEKQTPFQKEVDEMGRRLSYLISGFIVLIVAIQWFVTGTDLITLFLLAVGLLVAAIPEALPAIVTFALALGSRRMIDQNALVRRLPVVESLGSVNYLITDKTGTLTSGTMTVRTVSCGGHEVGVSGVGTETGGEGTADGADVDAEAVAPVLRCGHYANDARKTADGFEGDPTETALLVAAEKCGIEAPASRVRTIPFTSERKRMTTITDEGTAYMKGASEVVLDRCDRIVVGDEVVPMTEKRRREIEERVSTYASEALRVLAFARASVDEPQAEDEQIESELVFLGLQAMIDPPREEVKDAIGDCRTAGIDVVMSTGDDITTATAIGERLGFDPERAMTGDEIETMDDEKLQQTVTETEIFARVSPVHKVRILEAVQQQDLYVAMTGDGVNDAPALKNADVGVAMGQQGTDVAKQSSDLVLLDDNFVTIRDAIEEGRTIFDNIRKVTNYLLSTNSAEVMFVFWGALIGTFLFPAAFSGPDAVVLSAVMILWVNFMTDGPPAIALAADQSVPNVMERDPRDPDESIIDTKIIAMIALTGPLAALWFLPLFFAFVEAFHLAQTMLFTSLTLFEIVMFQIIRREYGLGIFSNRWLVAAAGVAFFAHLVLLYTPIRHLFDVVPLGISHWVYLVGFIVMFVVLMSGFQVQMHRLFGLRQGSVARTNQDSWF